MIMKTDILDYKNCTCIMISKKVQTFIFNPLLLFSRFRFAHKAMRKKKKKKTKIIILSILLFKISFDIAYFGSEGGILVTVSVLCFLLWTRGQTPCRLLMFPNNSFELYFFPISMRIKYQFDPQ